MGSSDLKDVAYISQRHKDIVYGFIKDVFKSFPSDNSYYTPDGLISSICLLYYFTRINSKILTVKESSAFINLLEKESKFNNLGNYKWNLIYRLSDDGFSFNIFREKCHELKNIVAIIHSDTNNVFGGYLSVGWQKYEDYFAYQKDPNAFLFLIRSSKDYPMELFNVKEKEDCYISCVHDEEVCIFGGGWDICIAQDCAVDNYSYTRGHNFGVPNEGYLNGDKKCFFAKDIECFQLK